MASQITKLTSPLNSNNNNVWDSVNDKLDGVLSKMSNIQKIKYNQNLLKKKGLQEA